MFLSLITIGSTELPLTLSVESQNSGNDIFSAITSNRKAISAVLTTIIILVAAIVLGTGVVVYSTSLFQTGGQQQSIQVQGIKGWVNSSAQQTIAGNPFSGQYAAWGAAAIRNSGDKILSIDTISMRGATIPYNNWFADTNQTRVNFGSNFQSQFNVTRTDQLGYPIGTVGTGGGVTGGTAAGSASGTCTTMVRGAGPLSPNVSFQIDEDNFAGPNIALCLTQQSGPVSLNPGQATIIYWQVPNGVFSGLDSGAITTVSIFAGKVGAPQTIRMSNPQ